MTSLAFASELAAIGTEDSHELAIEISPSGAGKVEMFFSPKRQGQLLPAFAGKLQ